MGGHLWSSSKTPVQSPRAEADLGFKNGKEMGKSPLYASVAKARSGAFSIGQATGREHARLKKELARGFTKTALRDHHDLISGHIDKMLETFRISSSHGRPALVSQSCKG